MTPQHLLALFTITCHAWFTQAILIKPRERVVAPEFWWDLTFNRDAAISRMLLSPLTSKQIDDRENNEYLKLDWDFEWAYGISIQWLAGGHGFWSAWVWNSTADEKGVTGGGFIYNETKLGVVAGVNWMQSGPNGAITWNCFVEGDAAGQLPWGTWELTLPDGTKIGSIKQDWKWGFTRGDNRVLSKHCATGHSVIGKRYKYYHGKEIESSVQNDPFQQATRHKRSPDFWEKAKETIKGWYQKVKNFFSGDSQDENNPEGRDGEKKCNRVVELIMRVIDFILGRKRSGSNPPADNPDMPAAPGGVPQGPNGEIPDGDPPGGANVPPADAEEIDTAQNDAVRDWE